MNGWPELTADALRHFPTQSQAGEAKPVLASACRTLAEGWKKCFDSLLKIRELEDDWDGQGAPAPPHDVVDSALILAVQLRQRGVHPPTVTVQGVAGDVGFEWIWPDGSNLGLDVEEPYAATLHRFNPESGAALLPLFELVAA